MNKQGGHNWRAKKQFVKLDYLEEKNAKMTSTGIFAVYFMLVLEKSSKKQFPTPIFFHFKLFF